MKIIASDFDGTLRRGRVIDPNDINAIDRWRGAGNRFGFATGRGLISIIPAAKDVPSDFYVCCGGGAVYDGKGELISETNAPFDIVAEIIPIGMNYSPVNIGMHTNGKWVQFKTATETFPIPEDIKWFHLLAYSFPDRDIAAEFTKELNTKLSRVINAQHNGVCVDIAAAGVTKATGISDYIRHENIEKENVITIGDNLNDYEMITTFNGVTVSNGVDGIKQIARKIYNNFTELVEDNM